MNQQELLLVISKYLSRFREQVNILNANGEFSINIHAENVLIGILNIVYDCDFENVNYVEGKNYGSIDLRDKQGKLAIQVTATSSLKKVRHTLEGYISAKHYENFSGVKVLILTNKQDSYSQDSIDTLVGDSFGFSVDEDIIDLRTIYVLLNQQNDLKKILAVKELLESQFSDRVLQEPTISVSSFEELCTVLRPYFDENGRIFRMFGPNSGANDSGSLRWDLSLWYKSREERILPNNHKICSFISEYNHLIPAEYKNIFDLFLTHAYAFEKHCQDSNFDYSEHQFPKDIIAIINDFSKK